MTSSPAASPPQFLDRPDGERIAYRARDGKGTGAVWLGGFKSDMIGTKASVLDDWAVRTGRPFLRFDYFGHGESSGDFKDGTISRWVEDALAALDHLSDGRHVLVGSSMGGWITIHAAMKRPEKVAGIVFIAPAPDFTEKLMWARFSDEIKDQIMTEGAWERPSEYDPEPYTITRALIEDGRENLVLNAPIPITCPVRILHGMQDPDVPWEHSLTLIDRLSTDDVVTNLIKDGDHRLSDPVNLDRLVHAVDGLCKALDTGD